MASPFWTYFADKLHWPQAFAPGPLQALVRGLAHHLDTTRDDMPYLRQQFFPSLCESDLVPEHGLSRSLVRHPRETPEQFRQRVVHAYGWHMLGGKRLGLPEILQFYGFDIVSIDNRREWAPSHWAEFEIQLKSPERNSDIPHRDFAQLVWLVNEYKPARSVLRRVYNDLYDDRFIIWTRRSAWSRFYWSFCSGVRDPETGVIVSLGGRHAAQGELGEPCAFAVMESCGGLLVRYVRSWIWGYSRWSDKYPPACGFVHGQLGTHLVERDDRPWLFRGRRVAREQLVWSGADMSAPVGQWSDINCRWSKGAFLLFRSPRWGASRWSESNGRELVVTLERRRDTRTGFALLSGDGLALPFSEQTSALRLELYPENFWKGNWNLRNWSPAPPVPHRSSVTRLPRLRWSSRAVWGKAVW